MGPPNRNNFIDSDIIYYSRFLKPKKNKFIHKHNKLIKKIKWSQNRYFWIQEIIFSNLLSAVTAPWVKFQSAIAKNFVHLRVEIMNHHYHF